MICLNENDSNAVGMVRVLKCFHVYIRNSERMLRKCVGTAQLKRLTGSALCGARDTGSSSQVQNDASNERHRSGTRYPAYYW